MNEQQSQQNVSAELDRKVWSAPRVIEASVEANTEGATNVASDGIDGS